jgi:D-tyrosyl-tRNA(Tyr) deacylase
VRIVLQRVSRAAVTVDGEVVGSIGTGMLLLAGVSATDTDSDVGRVVEKVTGLRVFPDESGLMNLSLLDVGGAVLVVSQFTLFADIRKGRRPSFTAAADPEVARPLVDALVAGLRAAGLETGTGVFGASMEVELVNDGPVTIVFEVRDGRVI